MQCECGGNGLLVLVLELAHSIGKFEEMPRRDGMLVIYPVFSALPCFASILNTHRDSCKANVGAYIDCGIYPFLCDIFDKKM